MASIYRRARSSPRHTTAGPNEDAYCIGCQAIMPNGFWIYSVIDIGPRGIFVCDDCLEKAKKAVRLGADRAQSEAKL